jgi:hypothetical protein
MGSGNRNPAGRDPEQGSLRFPSGGAVPAFLKIIK